MSVCGNSCVLTCARGLEISQLCDFWEMLVVDAGKTRYY